MDENSPVRNQLMVGVGVLLAVALLIGGIVAIVALKAADVAGLGDTDPTGTGNEGPPLGVGTNTRPPDPTSAPTTPAPATTTTTTTETQAPTTPTDTTKTSEPPATAIRLNASPDQAGTYERVNLTGTYPRGEGSTLQVQRQEGGVWVDFPTGATVSDGTFSTYIETGHTGPNRFRVIDESGRASNVVVVQIS